MKKFLFVILFCGFGLNQLFAQTNTEKLYQPSVLIELFSSEGCGSCPYADQFLKEVIHISDSSKSPVYVIDYHVVIWNKSGWIDPFSDSAYSLRQQEYVYRKNLKALYTPMVFINGSDKDYAGGDKRGIGMGIQAALSKPSKHYLRSRVTGIANEDSLLIAYQTWGNIDSMQLMAAFVQKEINSQVKGGENAGLILHHQNVVKGIYTQAINSSEGMFKIPANEDLNLENFRIVLFLQHKRTWEVVATDQLNFNFEKIIEANNKKESYNEVGKMENNSNNILIIPFKNAGTKSIPVSINGQQEIDFIFDTGASESTMPMDVAKTLVRMKLITNKDFLPEKSYILADGSKVTNQRVLLKKIAIGGYEIQNVEFAITNSNSDPLLGQNVLGRFKSISQDNTKGQIIITIK